MPKLKIDRKSHELQKGAVFLPVIVATLLIGAATFFIFQNGSNQNIKPSPSGQNFLEDLKATPTPTPVPFEEMTIPYLRSQNYDSSLAELEEFSQTSTHTYYLTNYDSGGDSVNGLLAIPNADAPEEGWPAVVFIHGYIPPKEYETTQNYVSYMEPLAREGLVVFKIDLRGHDDSEGVAHGAYFAETYVVDTLNAHSALKNAEFVDSEKIGLWGHSMAGNVVFRSLVANPEIKKGVIWAGAVYTYEDFDKFSIQDTSYQPPPQDSERRLRRERLGLIHGSFNPESEFWKQVVPTNYLEGVSTELQIHHAVNDPVVDIRYSRNLLEVLEGSEINAKLFEYSTGGHNITGESFTQAMQRSADFLTN